MKEDKVSEYYAIITPIHATSDAYYISIRHPAYSWASFKKISKENLEKMIARSRRIEEFTLIDSVVAEKSTKTITQIATCDHSYFVVYRDSQLGFGIYARKDILRAQGLFLYAGVMNPSEGFRVLSERIEDIKYDTIYAMGSEENFIDPFLRGNLASLCQYAMSAEKLPADLKEEVLTANAKINLRNFLLFAIKDISPGEPICHDYADINVLHFWQVLRPFNKKGEVHSSDAVCLRYKLAVLRNLQNEIEEMHVKFSKDSEKLLFLISRFEHVTIANLVPRKILRNMVEKLESILISNDSLKEEPSSIMLSIGEIKKFINQKDVLCIDLVPSLIANAYEKALKNYQAKNHQEAIHGFLACIEGGAIINFWQTELKFIEVNGKKIFIRDENLKAYWDLANAYQSLAEQQVGSAISKEIIGNAQAAIEAYQICEILINTKKLTFSTDIEEVTKRKKICENLVEVESAKPWFEDMMTLLKYRV